MEIRPIDKLGICHYYLKHENSIGIPYQEWQRDRPNEARQPVKYKSVPIPAVYPEDKGQTEKSHPFFGRDFIYYKGVHIVKNKLFILSTCGIVALSLAGCGAQSGTGSTGGAGANASSSSAAQNGASKTVAVASINDYPPFEFEKNGQLDGFDIELMQEVANAENLKVNWKVMKFDGIIPALQANQVDAAISDITIRADRAQVVNFTPTYIEDGATLVVKKGSQIKSVSDLKGKTIVAKQGTTNLTEAQKLAQQYGAKVTIVQDDASLYLAVESGQADAMIQDYAGVAYKIKTDGDNSKIQIVGSPLTNEPIGIAVSKSNSTLLNELSEGLKKLKANGEYDKLHSEYFGS
jgi:glutamine transport system substrate-binding protein